MKKLLSLMLALCVLLSCTSALALNYQQQFDHPATFETLEEARVNGPAVLSGLTGRKYVADPALDTYPAGTTYVYRSADFYTSLSAAYRMNTNILVYADKAFEGKDAALAYIKELGLTDVIDQAVGSVVLVTPANGKAFAAADAYAYFQLQAAMCNLGFSQRGADGSTYYADNTYYGGLTYRYVIGIDGGATFINDFIAGTLDNISRVAGLLLYGGKMEDISKVAGLVPTYLVNASEKTIAKYTAANETDGYAIQAGKEFFFNQARTQQCVVVDEADALDAALVKDVYYNFLINAMRVPVIKAGENNGNMLYSNYNFNQTPYTLSKRIAIVDGKTNTGMVLLEKKEDRFSAIASANGEYLETWYEFLPEEVLNNTAPAKSVPLWLGNHGGGDDPVQFLDEIGLLELASTERHAIVAAENQSIGNDIRAEAFPALVKYMLETYPALDPARVYTTGYSMGGGATFAAICGEPSLFAAAIPMAAVTHNATEEQEARFENTDLPVLLLTSTYDYFYDTTTWVMRQTGMCDYPTMMNDYKRYNGIATVDAYDFTTYPLVGCEYDAYVRTTLNNEYNTHLYLFNNDAGVPMVGLSVTEFLPHGLYPEYAKVAWNFAKHYSRDVETGEVVYDAFAQ